MRMLCLYRPSMRVPASPSASEESSSIVVFGLEMDLGCDGRDVRIVASPLVVACVRTLLELR
jgi:hypothetical protein